LFGNGPWPAGTHLSISVMGLPPVSIDATQMGLCGGMSFLTRDIFEYGASQLRGARSDLIPLPLAQHILDRLVDSFNGPAVVAHWLSATQALDHDTVVRGPGLFHQTELEVPAVIAEVDAGRLCPIGLVLVQSFAPWAVFQNHVVLVWGYEQHGDILTLRTYDCNRPGRDDIVIQLDISSTTQAKTITTNGTGGPVPGQIRGFFHIPYSPKDPEPAYIDDASVRFTAPPPARMAPGAQATAPAVASNTGSTTWTSTQGYRLGSQDPQDNTNWGLDRVDLQAASVDPGQDATFIFTVTAPKIAGGYAFAWQMVREGVRWIGAASPSLVIAVGSDAGVCSSLHQQAQALAANLAEIRDEIATIDWSDPVTARYLAGRLATQARTVESQLAVVEGQQRANGCAPG